VVGGLCGLGVGRVGGRLAGAQAGKVLAVAGAVDVEADGGHGEAVEDGGGDGGVTEVLSPGAELEVGGDGGGAELVPAINQIPEHMGRGRGVAMGGDLAEADEFAGYGFSARDAGEVVVFVQVAGLGAALAQPVLELLARRVGDVLVEGPGLGGALEDPRDRGVIEGAVALGVAQGSEQIVGPVALAQPEDLAGVVGGVEELGALEALEDVPYGRAWLRTS